MQLARFWSKIESTAQTPAGTPVPFVCWRGSATSAAEAQAFARAAAGAIPLAGHRRGAADARLGSGIR